MLRLERFGPFKLQEIELAPLTILFGPNGAGKSTVLDAIEEALTLSGGGPGGRDSSSAVVYATLDDCSIPGSSDERIMRHVLWKNLEGFDDRRWSLTDPYADCPSLENLLVRKGTEMIQSGPHGTREARTRIAAHLLSHSVLAFGGLQGDTDGSWGLVCIASLDEVAEFADMIDGPIVAGETEHEVSDAYFDTDDDELLIAVKMLRSGHDAIVTKEWAGPQGSAAGNPLVHSRSPLNTIRPLPLRLDFEPVTLDFELEEFAGRIAARLTSSNRHTDDMAWLTVSHPPEFSSTDESNNEQHVVSAQTWAGIANAMERASYRLVPRDSDEHVVSPLIRSAVERIASHANSIAPKFLVEDSQIDIEILDPSKWKPNAPRIHTTMHQNGMKVPLARVGSGIARWAAYSIRLACQELLDGSVIGDPSMKSGVMSHKGVQYLMQDEATTYAEVSTLEVLPGNLDVVLLIDEPEAHLHPRAVASVGEWLIDIAPRVTSVVVATHHPSLFNLRASNIQKHVVFKKGRRSSSEPWDSASEDLVAQLASDIGLTSGDLFMMSRYVLFVEGPHDLVILEELFGEVLRGSSIRLLPLHGAHNISLLATSDIVWQMGIPIGVLTDDTNIDGVTNGERSSHMDKLVDRMLREVKAEGRTVDAFGLALDDVLFYLDDEVTATFAKEGFPGWRAARTIWGEKDQPSSLTANGSKFKGWVTSTYGLDLDRDSVRSMARKCKAEGKIPEELAKVVADVVSRTL